jgi:two-component system cell cycle response regulator DivK
MAELLLVIEDDDDVREIVCELLEARGFDVVAAHTAKLGMSILKAGLRPGAILLDLRMEGFNGIDFRRAQLAQPSLRAIPVVAMTGNPGTLEEHPDLPWTGVLHKPLAIEDVVLAVDAAIRRSR